MGRGGSFKYKEFEKLQKKLEKSDKEVNEFIEMCAKNLAARLLSKVIKRTPVGDYTEEVRVIAKRDSKKHKKGDLYTKRVNQKSVSFTTSAGKKVKFKAKTYKQGGTLRKGWTTGKSQGDFVDTLRVNHFGDTYVITITNSIEYASYVEFGHRRRNGKGWTKGKFMLTISEQELQKDSPKILEAKLKKWLEGEMFGK